MSEIITLNRSYKDAPVQIAADATVEQLRDAGGINWDILEQPVAYAAPDGTMMTVPNRKALVRSDNLECLGIHSLGYKTVQPKDVVEFHGELVDKMGFQLDTIGCLGGGRHIWTVSKAGEGTSIMGQDTVKPYLLLATSYDGSLATVARFIEQRMVCTNQIQFLYGDDSLRVSHRTVFRPEEIHRTLGLVDDRWGEHVEQIETIARVPLTPELTTKFIKGLWGDDAVTTNDAGETLFKPSVNRVLEAAANSPGARLRSADGTLWGIVNGVTYDVDHVAGRNSDTRQTSAWFGRGSKQKRAAFDLALELAEAA